MSLARPRRRTTLLSALAVLTLAIGTTAVLPGVAAAAPSPDAVVAEVYGGGGNAGATLTNDFVELGNRGAAPVALGGVSVQYLPAAPTATSTWQVTPLTGTLPANGRFLVGEGKGAGGTAALPAPDTTGTINMSGTAGTVALVQGTAALTCTTAADCAADPRIRDLVGYGAAAVREGTPAPATTNTTSDARPATLADTDVNAADFVAGAPTPTNAAGQSAGGPTGPQPPTQPGPARIHDVQGTTRRSPLAGQRVEGVPGIVTAVRTFGSSRGFWFQDPTPDADPRTSEALFAFTGSASPTVAVGDDVLVSGTVDEFRPGSATGPDQSVTELTGPLATVRSSGDPLPAAEALTPTTVPQQYAPAGANGDIEARPLDPGANALDWYESREGMRLSLADARVVGPTTTFDELWVTSKPAQNPTIRGGTAYNSYADPNSGRIKVESLIPFAQRPFPQVNVGDQLTGTTAGVLDYDAFGGYLLQATDLGQAVPGTTAPEVTRKQGPAETAIATYNVENLDPTDPPAKFTRLAQGIVTNLAAPDIVALEEIQDNDGPTDDGVVAADRTLTQLTDAIVAAGGPRYQFREIDPVNDTNGGEPGGNIRSAFLFNPARVAFHDRPGGTATTPVRALPRRTPLDPIVSASPGLVDPQNPAWQDSRKPLVGEFASTLTRLPFLVVANHLVSKGGDQPIYGRFQPPARSSEVQRNAQATVLRGFLDQLDTASPFLPTPVATVGDFNDYPFSPALGILTANRPGSLPLPFTQPPRDLIAAQPPNDRYTYDFQGNSQALDHILLSDVFRSSYDIVHVNAEFADQVSDHDPQVVRIGLP